MIKQGWRSLLVLALCVVLYPWSAAQAQNRSEPPQPEALRSATPKDGVTRA